MIELVIGWFLLEKAPGIVGARGLLATVIKLIGVLFLIGGFVSLAHSFFNF